MSKTYNTIGSLTALKSHLEENNIYDFKSLKEVIDFQSSFAISRQQLISHHKNLIEEEQSLLNVEMRNLETVIENQRQQTEQILNDEIDKLKQQLNSSISNNPTNLFQKLTKELRHWNYKRKIKHKEKEFDSNVKATISHLTDDYQRKIVVSNL